MRIAQEEIFGPVISAIPFTDVEEVIRRDNATTFGLGGGMWTRDVSMAPAGERAPRECQGRLDQDGLASASERDRDGGSVSEAAVPHFIRLDTGDTMAKPIPDEVF